MVNVNGHGVIWLGRDTVHLNWAQIDLQIAFVKFIRQIAVDAMDYAQYETNIL